MVALERTFCYTQAFTVQWSTAKCQDQREAVILELSYPESLVTRRNNEQGKLMSTFFCL